MQKLDKVALKVFLYGLPAVIVMAVFDSFIDPEALGAHSLFVQKLYNFSGFVFATWMVLSLYLSARLIVVRAFREEVLTKLAWFRERDEREVFLSGQATKMSFLTSLAILICLLCLSTFQVSLYQVPADKAPAGKNHTLTLGFNLGLTDKAPPASPKDISKSYIAYSGLPLSKGAIVLFLIVWQIASYNYAVRRRSPGIAI